MEVKTGLVGEGHIFTTHTFQNLQRLAARVCKVGTVTEATERQMYLQTDHLSGEELNMTQTQLSMALLICTHNQGRHHSQLTPAD